MSSLKVGIIGLKCHDQLTAAEMPRYLGGIETQLATLARGLVSQGCEVTVITYDHGQPDDDRYEGVRLLKSHAPNSGLRLLRNIHPRTTGLLGAMRRAGADVYLQMGAGIETGQTALGCRLLGRPFVFCLASDADFGAHLNAGPWGLEGKAYRCGLNHANQIIAQTETQRQGLHAATGRNSTVIPMAVLPPSGQSVDDTKPHVLWVGRITPTKRLDWLIEAARRCPEAAFDIVGTPNQQSGHATSLMDEARFLPNVRVHGRAAASILANLYADATLLACTSVLEGFPTTFLEAWSIGLPVVTTFDPDGVVATHGLGEVAGDLNDFVARLTGLLGDASRRAICATAARSYYQSNHSIAEVSRRFHQMFESAAKGKSRKVESLKV
ncbi:MAG: glycosyltransferase family 4 protein [Verrucomicrobia bacterium]|nr:glycosyltransferase family 4 protein [Verrucomicrobiota bacterium]